MLASVCRMVALVGLAIPVTGPCVWLGGTCWVGCAARVEATVEDKLYGTVALVEDCGGELVVVLVNTEDEVGTRGGVVIGMVEVVVGVVMAVLEAVDLVGSSSVICDLSVTVTGEVVRKTLVTSGGISVRD